MAPPYRPATAPAPRGYERASYEEEEEEGELEAAQRRRFADLAFDVSTVLAAQRAPEPDEERALAEAAAEGAARVRARLARDE
jgi:hypothetical protein